MTQNASFIPPNVTPPDPLEAKVASLVFSIFMSVILISIIGLVCIDFLAEMTGVLLISETQETPPDVSLFAEEVAIESFMNPFELITPQHHTQMIGPRIVVIYTRRLQIGHVVPPELLVNGSSHPWDEQFGNNVWFALLQLPAGQHHVQVDESEAEFFVESLDSLLRAPELWTWNHPHPDTDKVDRCSDCHDKSNQPTYLLSTNHNRSIGSWKGVASCFACHDEEEHSIRHAFIQPTTKQCLRCHTVH